ncbi:MAG: sugar phosphate isomerase/epimerase [Negativicutes bacterium]|nr:sugar phosphate isomerase/epimerase [Negativicutes bacterium]
MRLLISALTWEPFLLSGMCQLELVPLADKYSCAGVEFRPYWRSSIEELPEIKEFLAEYGLVSTYAVNECLLDVTEAEVRKSLAAMQANISLAERLGSGVMRINIAPASFNRSFLAAEWWQQEVAAVIAFAKEKGVVLVVENAANSVGGDPRLIRDIIKTFASPWLKATFDTGSWLSAGWDPARALDILAGHIGYVHLKDMTEDNLPTYPGAGRVDLLGLIDSLDQSGYEGLYALEIPGGQSPAGSVKASLRYLRQE